MGKSVMERKNTEKGFSLIESVISLFLFLLVILFSLECFQSIRTHFFELKTSEEWNTAAYAALDRMKRDFLEAGWGLTEVAKHTMVGGIIEEGENLILVSREKDLSLKNDLVIGQQRIEVEDARPVKKGHEVCIFDSFKGEVHSVAYSDKDSFVLVSPLTADYVQKETDIILLRKISLFFDQRRGVIRRKVNSSPAQPLLEDVNFFGFEHFKKSNLVRVQIKLKIDEENNHEAVVFPKNTGMLSFQGK
jgi:hypothetical protein